jgi:N6-L-threonylcarbamoyladenine synthase
MKILAIDTSCDETSAAVTEGAQVLSNVIWSQASAHANFGGVMPSLAKRMHEERIDWVVNKALINYTNIGAVAVTQGPGLAIALEVGVKKAKELALGLSIPLVPINHIEGHLLSPLANKRDKVQFPAFGLVVSGGHTELVYIEKIGKYKILAKTQDDALGEALDKAARMLGLGYPGGAVLEKMARMGNAGAYNLPLPMARSLDKTSFSYSGLKTAFYRMTNNLNPSREQIYDLAASFQNRAFQHLEKVIRNTINTSLTLPGPLSPSLGERKREVDLLVGGGVSANVDLRKRLRKLGKELGLNVRFPYSTKLIGDNAAMIGVAASFKEIRDYGLVDRRPRWGVEEV